MARAAPGTATRASDMDKTLAELDIEKAARMRLLGEDKIYTWEYERCLERIEARKRAAARRAARAEARRLSSNTNGSVSTS